MRILIVEDKEENAYYLRALLQGNGYQVESADHGVQALVMAGQALPDIVISDLLMPVMDGYALLRYWKADSRLKQIPFVVYTATYTEAEDERLAYDLGADDFILKPCEPEKFLARLLEVLSRDTVSKPSMAGHEEIKEMDTLQHYSQILIRKLEEKTLQLQDTNRALEKELASLKGKLASSQGDELVAKAVDINGIKVLAATLDGADIPALRETMDKLKDKLKSAAIVLAAVSDGKVSLIAGVTKDATAKVKAGDLVNFVAQQVGGKGGGRPDMAQAGGTDPSGLPKALAGVSDWVRERA